MTNTTNFGQYLPAVNDVIDQDQWGEENNALHEFWDEELALRTLDYDFSGFNLINPVAKNFSESSFGAGNISGSVTLTYSNGNYQYAILTGNISNLTISGWPASGTLGFMTLELNQDGTGSRLLSLPSNYKTPAGAGITLTTSAMAVDFLYLTTRDGGATINTSSNKDFR